MMIMAVVLPVAMAARMLAVGGVPDAWCFPHAGGQGEMTCAVVCVVMFVGVQLWLCGKLREGGSFELHGGYRVLRLKMRGEVR